MDLNSYIRIVFQDKKTFDHIDDSEKESYFFMFNRLMGRLLPFNAEALNKKNIDKYLATVAWFKYCKSYSSVPNQMKINWSKYKKPQKNGLLKEYDSIDQKILSYYPDVLEELKKIDDIKDEDIKTLKIKKKK